MKNNKGITLIALVITIIVLLILAGITIAMLTGENGILNNATKSKAINELGAAKDLVALKANEAMTSYFESTYVKTTSPQYSNDNVRKAVCSAIEKMTNLPTGVSMPTKPSTTTTTNNVTTIEYANDKTIQLSYGDYTVFGVVDYNGSLRWGEAKAKKEFNSNGNPTYTDADVEALDAQPQP